MFFFRELILLFEHLTLILKSNRYHYIQSEFESKYVNFQSLLLPINYSKKCFWALLVKFKTEHTLLLASIVKCGKSQKVSKLDIG